MRRPRLQKRIYNVLGLVLLIYTLVGSCFSFGTTVDHFGPPSTYRYDIRNDPMAMGIFFLATGIPLFLLILLLKRRAAKNDLDTQSPDKLPPPQ